MKVFVVLLILVVAAFVFLFLKGFWEQEAFDPTQQGEDARAAIKIGSAWTEVIEAAGEPSRWKEGASDFDFVSGYTPFDAEGRDTIRKGLEKKELEEGFSFLYRFSDAATFAVNFDSNGTAMNIQKKQSKKELLGG
jgi:hypothetical protein